MIGINSHIPLFIYGNIFNLTFLEIPNLQITKDQGSPVPFINQIWISLALAFVFLPLYLILSLFIFSPWWLGILIFLTLPLSGLFAWNYYLAVQKDYGRIQDKKTYKTKE